MTSCNLKVFHDVLDVGKAGWLARQTAGTNYYGLSVPMPLPGAHQTAGKSLVATNGDAKPPCYHGFGSHAWGSSNINWPFPF